MATKSTRSRPKPASTPKRIQLNERQVALLVPLLQEAQGIEAELGRIKDEVSKVLLALAPGDAETVQLDVRTDPWTLIVEK